jgi:hypothetical protein
MASYTGVTAIHKTLAASTVDTVTLTGCTTQVTIVNRNGVAEIYFTVGATTPPVPTVGGVNTYVIPADVSSYTVPFAGSSTVVVSLISGGIPTYSVEAE